MGRSVCLQTSTVASMYRFEPQSFPLRLVYFFKLTSYRTVDLLPWLLQCFQKFHIYQNLSNLIFFSSQICTDNASPHGFGSAFEAGSLLPRSLPTEEGARGAGEVGCPYLWVLSEKYISIFFWIKWIYDRGDCFPFDFEPNRILFG